MMNANRSYNGRCNLSCNLQPAIGVLLLQYSNCWVPVRRGFSHLSLFKRKLVSARSYRYNYTRTGV